jgi:hypothetical protein
MNLIASSPVASILGAAVRELTKSLLLVCFLAFSGHSAQAAKNTPFGAEMIAANYPNTSSEDVIRALALTSLVGGHSSHIWSFGNQDELAHFPGLVSLMRGAGLKSLLQVAPVFIDTPAPPEGYVRSFSDLRVRLLYLDSITKLARTRPDYLILATEINLLYRFNEPEFEYFRTLYRDAYALVKRISPNTKVGLSYLYTLWYAHYVLNNIDVPAMLEPADFIAFTTYPEELVFEGPFASIEDMPPEWYGAARMAYPNKLIGFSEVGWSSKLNSTPERQAEFVRHLPRLMSVVNPEFVTWAVLHDVDFFAKDKLLTPELISWLEGFGVDIDRLFGRFNAMGLLEGNGVAKPGLYEAFGLDFGQ